MTCWPSGECAGQTSECGNGGSVSAWRPEPSGSTVNSEGAGRSMKTWLANAIVRAGR